MAFADVSVAKLRLPSHSPRPAAAVGLLALGLGAMALWAAGEVPPASTPPATQSATRPADADLPPGAVYRLGGGRMVGGQRSSGAAFSPDGKLLASAHAGGQVCLWDAGTGRRVGSFQADVPAQGAAFSPDGRSLVVWTFNGVIVYDVATGGIPRPRLAALTRAAVSPDGTLLATESRGIKLWSLPGFAPVREIGPTHGPADGGERTFSLGFSADGKTLLSSASDGVARLWDVDTGKQRLAINVGSSWQLPAALSADGRVVATGGDIVRLWDAHSGTKLPRPRFAGGPGPVNNVAFSPVGSLLAVDRFTTGITLWDVAAGREGRTFVTGYSGTVEMAFSPDGKRLAAFGGGPEVWAWDVETGRPVGGGGDAGGGPPQKRGPVLSAAASPDGRWAATGDFGGHVTLWDARTGRPRRVPPPAAGAFTPFNAGTGPIFALRFGADGRSLFIRDGFGLGRWDLSTLKPAGEPIREMQALIHHEIALSGDGKTVAMAMDEAHGRDIGLYDAGTFKLVRQLPAGKARAESVAFAPARPRVAAIMNGQIKVWDTDTGEVVGEFRPPQPAWRVAWSPDGRYLAACDQQQTAWLWDATTLAPVRTVKPDKPDAPVRETGGGMPGLAFSPDGKLLAVEAPGGVDVWEAGTGGPVARLRGHEGAVHGTAFFPDGLRLLTGGYDTTAVVWDLRRVLPAPDPDDERFPRLLLDKAWRQLDAEDAETGYGAVAVMAARPADAVALLGERLADADARTPRRLDRSLAVLESIGSDGARKVLKDVAANEKRLADEVALALKRLDARAAAEANTIDVKDDAGDPAPLPTQPAAQPAPTPPATAPASQPAAVAGPLAGPPAFKPARVPPAPANTPKVPEAPVLTDPVAVRQFILKGDPAVLATAAAWLAQDSALPEVGRGTPRLRAALDVLAAFPVEAELPALVGLFNNPTADVTIRDRAAVAVARIGAPATKEFLTDALADPALGHTGRLRVAAALTALDVDAGRDELFGQFEDVQNLSQLPREALAAIADEKLAARLYALADRLGPGLPGNGPRTLADTMRVNALPLDDLWKAAEDTDWYKANARYDAIRALGRRAGPDAIARLEGIKPWPKGSTGDNPIQNGFVKDGADKAAAEIRRNHWSEMTAKGKP